MVRCPTTGAWHGMVGRHWYVYFYLFVGRPLGAKKVLNN